MINKSTHRSNCPKVLVFIKYIYSEEVFNFGCTGSILTKHLYNVSNQANLGGTR